MLFLTIIEEAVDIAISRQVSMPAAAVFVRRDNTQARFHTLFTPRAKKRDSHPLVKGNEESRSVQSSCLFRVQPEFAKQIQIERYSHVF